MKKIYIAHPYNNNPENKDLAEKYIREFVNENSKVLYLSPIHATGYMYEWYQYEEGIKLCFELLKLCDEIYICGDWQSSRGCRLEYEYALENNIPITFKG